MRNVGDGLVFRDLDRLFRHGTAPSGDGALLESFLTDGDESAFEALVSRHGPMVRGVCRRLSASSHDADDAFQATFLVLVRKGGRLRDPDRLGPWLHGVATRVAGKARARAGRRRDQPLMDVDVPAREGRAAEWSDLMPIIDAELARLPAKHRDVLVACLLDGATAEEASRRLECPVGTVKSRLARAREALRDRLTVRGVAPALAVAALSTESSAFASPVSSALIRATLKAATSDAVAPGVAALTKGVAFTMLPKFTFTTVALAGFALAGLGAAVYIQPSLAQGQPPQGEGPSRASKDAGKEGTAGNIKNILLAVHNYHDTNNYFPPPAIAGKGGQPLLSWRVALLPYLGRNDLYKLFRLDEPWDSPHNAALVEQMPDVFESPEAPASKGQTRFRGFAGKSSIFDPNAPARDVPGGLPGPCVRIADTTDGTSNTVFLAVARDATVWTKPGELPFIAGQELPALDESDPRGYPLGFCDGAVRRLLRDRQSVLPFLITYNGGEVVDHSSTFAKEPQPAPASTTPLLPTPPVAPTAPLPPIPPVPPTPPLAPIRPSLRENPSSSVEQRLQRLEEKIDRLIEKLEAGKQ